MFQAAMSPAPAGHGRSGVQPRQLRWEFLAAFTVNVCVWVLVLRLIAGI